jgi:general secretion pathway protein H
MRPVEFPALKALQQQGFTLLELLVVLVITVMMVALVPPLLSRLAASAELKGTTRQLAAALRYARDEAITRHSDGLLELDLGQRRFRVTGSPREFALPESIAVKLFTARSELLDEVSGSIRFFPDGSSTGGHITLASGRLAYTVNVDWLTGRVSIQQQD